MCTHQYCTQDPEKYKGQCSLSEMDFPLENLPLIMIFWVPSLYMLLYQCAMEDSLGSGALCSSVRGTVLSELRWEEMFPGVKGPEGAGTDLGS